MNRNVIFILAVVVVITGLLLVGKRASKMPPTNANVATNGQAASSSLQNSGDPAKGSIAPTFELKSIPDGKVIPIASLHGKAVLLNFWATWCGPCKIEMPWLVDLQKKYGPQGLQIVGVAMDDTDDKEINDFTHKMGVNYIVLKGTEKVGDLYGGVDRLPLTYYIDRSGKVVDETVGLAGESVIEDAVKKALQQGS
ncbi:MAG TPA: TlpA disulfide reductase family protein [Candidatus Angelobacter sp.]|nr:TlpA disulfide reductase family protein [Candidatus Angelobacter sp.]